MSIVPTKSVLWRALNGYLFLPKEREDFENKKFFDELERDSHRFEKHSRRCDSGLHDESVDSGFYQKPSSPQFDTPSRSHKGPRAADFLADRREHHENDRSKRRSRELRPERDDTHFDKFASSRLESGRPQRSGRMHTKSSFEKSFGIDDSFLKTFDHPRPTRTHSRKSPSEASSKAFMDAFGPVEDPGKGCGCPECRYKSARHEAESREYPFLSYETDSDESYEVEMPDSDEDRQDSKVRRGRGRKIEWR